MADFLLQEDSTYLLLEDGGRIVLADDLVDTTVGPNWISPLWISPQWAAPQWRLPFTETED